MGISEIRARFAQLHATEELFVMPNPWDVGSAKELVRLGFPALATTSSGHAASLGRSDGEVTRDELIKHVRAITSAVDVPLNVDSERLFSEDLKGVAQTVRLLGDAGASGCSIEDWKPSTSSIGSVDVAVERVAAAVTAADALGMVLTARAENHIRGVDDLEDTVARLRAYRDVGAHCLYAPGLTDLSDIKRVVDEVAVPVNVLALPSGPSISQLAEIGVRRVSTGGALAVAAYSALRAASERLLDK
ncbi:MAG: isocitrate lyase/phosphoenolpyruvate mutase family protein [Actinomycetota bacterium]|nr:isocitrate lyase/phosphoenolpyruvate mutase family protein [Actinomycetota bacterium]